MFNDRSNVIKNSMTEYIIIPVLLLLLFSYKLIKWLYTDLHQELNERT